MSNRLLVFTESYERGGGNRYMIDLANAVADDFEHVNFVSNPSGIYAEDLVRFKKHADVGTVPILTRTRLVRHLSRIPGATRRVLSLILITCEPLMLLANIWLFCRLFARLQPTQIFACNGGYPASPACLAAVLSARLYGVPAVMSIVSMPSKRRPYLWFYDAALDGLVWRASRMVVVNAKAIGVALEAMRGMPRYGAVVVHNGIENNGAVVTPSHVGTFVIGYLARLDAMKGVLVLLDAFTVLTNGRSDLRLVLAGDGDASAEVAARVHERGLQNKVALLGHFSGNVDELLRGFDIFAFPSLWEGFPYSIVEAMRSECAIVATRVGGIPEAIEDGREGLLIEAGDVAALAAAMSRMIDDPPLRATCSRAARLRFLREFSLSEMQRRAKAILMETVK